MKKIILLQRLTASELLMNLKEILMKHLIYYKQALAIWEKIRQQVFD
jgi:hypothetical protein